MPYLTSEVFLGEDEYMFLLGGTNKVAEFFTMDIETIQLQAGLWRMLILDRHNRLAEMGIKYYHLFGPEKLSVYREKAAEALEDFTSFQETIEELYCNGELKGILVPVLKYLKSGKEEYTIYPKTDTHWSALGCYRAYQMLCSIAGIEQRADLFANSLRDARYSGDLAMKLADLPKESFRISVMPIEAKRVWVNGLVQEIESQKDGEILHVGTMARYTNDSPKAGPQRVLLFGDSYSEYRPGRLTGMLADSVRELLFVWSASFDWNVVNEFQPDIVISETSERFGRAVPIDGIDIRELAADRIRRLQSVRQSRGIEAN